jgi:cytochrome c oxidase cbb3-type subunit IV
MNINDLRSAVTVLAFVLFLGLMRWVWASSRRQAFEAAAQLPFDGSFEAPSGGDGERRDE